MGVLKVSDNAATTLASAITNSASVTSIILADASKFPVVNHGGTGSDWSYATLFDSAGNIETVKVTRRDTGSNTLSVIRGSASGITGVNDASCRAWASGTTGVACRLVAQTVADIYQSSIDAATSASDAATSASAAATSASAAATSASAAQSAVAGLIPSGTRMPFAQATAPTGWTQITDDSATNRMLRVVNTVGGGTGGSHSPILNNVVPSHTHGFTTGNQSADHTHGIGDPGNGHTYFGGIGSGADGSGTSARRFDGNANDGTRWVQNSYTGIWTGGMSVNHTHSGSTDNGSSQTNWQPRYIDMIICSKN